MRILHLTSYYPDAMKLIEKKCAGDGLSFSQLSQVAFNQFIAWSNSWSVAFIKSGIEAFDLVWNFSKAQKAWADEHGFDYVSDYQITLEQVKSFDPNIIWFDELDLKLFDLLKSNLPKAKFIGWTGSAVYETPLWSKLDLILSCAPESVQFLRSRGAESEHLHHAFDPRVLKYIHQRDEKIQRMIFIGQIIRKSTFHRTREFLLKELLREIDLEIYSPSAFFTLKDEVLNLIDSVKFRIKPKLMVDPKLKRHMKPPVFGLEMEQVISDSAVTLNLHADSSPLYASNMRMFEVSGVGGCLLTDKKMNNSDLFSLDTEIIEFDSVEDCVEKSVYLLNHPSVSLGIGRAAQKKVLASHTFDSRAIQFMECISRHPKIF